AQLGLKYCRKVLGRSRYTYPVAVAGDGRRGVSYPLEDLRITGLERRILKPNDIVAWAAGVIERRCEGGRDRVVEHHGVGNRRAAVRQRCRHRQSLAGSWHVTCCSPAS